MPELPEVEVTRQSFAPHVAGAQVMAVRLGKPLRWPLGCAPESLQGQVLGLASRRGKYLWLPLDRGGLLMHLGMSGSLRYSPEDAPAGPHDHFDLWTSRGLLRLHDPRRFGAVVWSPSLQADPAARLLARLGVEPLEPGFDGAVLHAGLVGVGNIYACEALFAAGIDPRTPADRMSRPRCERLASAIRDTLAHALAAGGSTLRDFRDAHGHNGAFQDEARVYGREGEPCGVCATPIRRLVQGQRSTYFCPRCQRRS
jgi:formamidopyrimidine-DNA glycosylase